VRKPRGAPLAVLVLALAACGAEVPLPAPHAGPSPSPEAGDAELERWMPPEFFARVRALTGDGPIWCGVVRRTMAYGHLNLTPAEAPPVRDCIARARDSRRPFLFVAWGGAVDSLIAGGLLGTDTGRVLRFSYDSAPCGLEGACLDSFRIESCKILPSETAIDPNLPCEGRGPTMGWS
jgi:hypothetical protein